MVDSDGLEEMLRNFRRYMAELQVAAQIPRAQFLSQPLVAAGAKYYLQVAIEACIDIARHIIATRGWRKPADYRDVFSVLAENGVVSSDFLPTLRTMAGYRNRLVHLYWEVSDEEAYTVLQRDLADFHTFQTAITRYLHKEGDL